MDDRPPPPCVGWAQVASHLPLSREALLAVALARCGARCPVPGGVLMSEWPLVKQKQWAMESMEHHQFQYVSICFNRSIMVKNLELNGNFPE